MSNTLSKDIPHKWFIVLAVMLSTIMEILDTTIVNVSLPHMMGSLGADRDEISWVLTSYIVAAGILMPLTGFLVNRLGCRRLLLINIVGFMLASALCGLSVTLNEMVTFRLFQGIFGASLVPLSQYILRDTFPPEEQPKMMAIWGIGVMAAPVMGPTLGGFITDTLNWRWIFYINVPICVLNFFLVLAFIKETPLKKDTIDWIGMALMVVSVGTFQLFLDRGQVDDWFSSRSICLFFVTFIITFILFIWRSLVIETPIVNLKLFLNRNFAFGTLLLAFFSASVFGSITLFPQMLETLFGYDSNLAGLTMAPRGIASAIMMGVASRLMMLKYDPRLLIFFGLAICGYSTWILGTITLQTDINNMIMLGILQGIGIGCFFVPLSNLVYATLPKASIAEAAGLFSFGRNIGSACGISLLTTYLSRNTQVQWNHLSAYIQETSPRLQHWLNAQHLSLSNPLTIAKITKVISTQSNFVAFLETFKVGGLIALFGLLLVFLMDAPPKSKNFDDIPMH